MWEQCFNQDLNTGPTYEELCIDEGRSCQSICTGLLKFKVKSLAVQVQVTGVHAPRISQTCLFRIGKPKIWIKSTHPALPYKISSPPVNSRNRTMSIQEAARQKRIGSNCRVTRSSMLTISQKIPCTIWRILSTDLKLVGLCLKVSRPMFSITIINFDRRKKIKSCLCRVLVPITAQKTHSNSCTLFHSNCEDCTVTVPKHLHMQTGGVLMAAWLENAAWADTDAKLAKKVTESTGMFGITCRFRLSPTFIWFSFWIDIFLLKSFCFIFLETFPLKLFNIEMGSVNFYKLIKFYNVFLSIVTVLFILSQKISGITISSKLNLKEYTIGAVVPLLNIVAKSSVVVDLSALWGDYHHYITSQVDLMMKWVVNFVDFKLNNKHDKIDLSFAHPIFLEIIFECQNTVKDHEENEVIHSQGLMFFIEMIINHISYHFKRNLLNCLHNCSECTVTVPKHIHTQTCGSLCMNHLIFLSVFSPFYDLYIHFLCYDNIHNVDKSLAASAITTKRFGLLANKKEIEPQLPQCWFLATNIQTLTVHQFLKPIQSELSLTKPAQLSQTIKICFAAWISTKLKPLPQPLFTKPFLKSAKAAVSFFCLSVNYGGKEYLQPSVPQSVQNHNMLYIIKLIYSLGYSSIHSDWIIAKGFLSYCDKRIVAELQGIPTELGTKFTKNQAKIVLKFCDPAHMRSHMYFTLFYSLLFYSSQMFWVVPNFNHLYQFYLSRLTRHFLDLDHGQLFPLYSVCSPLWDSSGFSSTGELSSASAPLYIPQLAIYHLTLNTCAQLTTNRQHVSAQYMTNLRERTWMQVPWKQSCSIILFFLDMHKECLYQNQNWKNKKIKNMKRLIKRQNRKKMRKWLREDHFSPRRIEAKMGKREKGIENKRLKEIIFGSQVV
ncbi:hypothetical protein VP01_110g2 [Puccinia sorghi]|uniref:Uncharacterized protein n=1 Tax=Puccinia sorghi TaxID=27349 RepID=A0A0L6VSM0_9BASI|nr:hypothetical protein VP01_110g2 [Puccinia sorghi]